MKKYIFLTKDDHTTVVLKETLTCQELSALKAQGFKKHHLEIAAESEKEAIAKLHQDNEDNLKALSDFSINNLYPIFLLAVLLIAAYFFSS